MEQDKKIKLIVNNDKDNVSEDLQKDNLHFSNPIYGRYLKFTNNKSKKNNIFKVLFDELF